MIKKLHKNQLICKILAESSQGLKGNMVDVSVSGAASQSVSQWSVNQLVSQSKSYILDRVVGSCFICFGGPICLDLFFYKFHKLYEGSKV